MAGNDEVDQESLFSLSGFTALVTGANSGIGAAIATAYARAGASVFVHAKHWADASRAAALIGGTPVAADLSVPEQVEAMCLRLLEEPALDVLVNNAGIELGGGIEDLTPELLQATFTVNLVAPVTLCRRLLSLLSASPHGSIINISSIHDRVPSHSNGAYAASKAALRMMTETLAVELGPAGVRVNAIAPGAIATDINRTVIAEVGPEVFASLIPLGRVGQVQDVAGPAVFLASRAAAYITGATLVVDGAYSHHLVRYRGQHD